MELNPVTYHLPVRIELRVLGENHIGIIRLMKSRIIQKDAMKIVEQVRQIQSVDPSLQVSLICTANICSKSLGLLAREGIGVVIEEV